MSPSARGRLPYIAAVAWLAVGPTSAIVAQSSFEPALRLTSAAALSTETADPAVGDTVERETSESPWRSDLTLWLWIIGLEGDVGARGLTADVSADFGDIIDASDSIFAFAGRLELGYGPVAGFADGFYSDLGVNNARGPLGLSAVDVKFEQSIVDFGLTYRVGDWEPSGGAAKNDLNLTLDLYAGARYTGIDVKLRPELAADRSQAEDWFDPIVGAKLVVPFARHWHAGLNGDVGGFGAESELTWSAAGVVGFDFHVLKIPASVLAGYRAIGWDFSSGSGNNEFTWDVLQHGVLLGFSLRF